MHGVDDGVHDEQPHRILAVPGVVFCRGHTRSFRKYEYLFEMHAVMKRGNGFEEHIRAHIFRPRISLEKISDYLQLMHDRINTATYSRASQEVEVGSGEVVFCLAPRQVFAGYKKIFDLMTPTLRRAYIFCKRNPGEPI